MNWPAWRAALRIARRDALRHKGRSALVVAMIALPVLGVTAGEVLARSADLTPSEKLDRTIGAADAKFQIVTGSGAPIEQTPDGDSWGSWSEQGGPTASPKGTEPPKMDADQLNALLPAGTRVIERLDWSMRVRDAHRGVVPVRLDELDYADPIAKGLYHQVSGRAPRTASEVALTPRLSKKLDLKIGDTLTTVGGDQRFTVVGIVEDPSNLRAERAVILPQPGTDAPDYGRTYLVDTPKPVTWQDVLAYNKHGIAVTSRDVVLHPPPRADVPFYQHMSTPGVSTEMVAAASVAAGMALLEVVLLAGPAFAVGAKRSRRALALLAASGGAKGHVRNVVLASGIVLGVAGGVIGSALGLGLALAARPVLRRLAGADFGGLHLHGWEIGGIALLGLVTGVLAAMLPARSASRQDVVAALTGRRGTTRTPAALTVVGVAMLAIGIAIATYGALHASRATVILGGSIVAELGLVACTPALVGLAGRLGPLLPVGPRLALRDAARNRGRTAPAVAAIMAAVAGSVAVSVYTASSDAHQEQTYRPLLRPGQAAVQIDASDVMDPDKQAAAASDIASIKTALRTSLPTKDVYAVRHSGPGTYAFPDVPAQNQCPVSGRRPMTQADKDAYKNDWRCHPSQRASGAWLGTVLVGDAALFQALTGVDDPQVASTLARGGVVVFDRQYIADDTMTLSIRTDSDADLPKPVTLPALLIERGHAPGLVYMSEATAHSLGLEPVVTAVLDDTSAMPTAHEEAAARAALANTGSTSYLQVERGYQGDRSLSLLAALLASAVITLGASAIVTGLSAADSRPDFATLSAVGASPRTRRMLAMFSSAVTALLGALLGVLAGFVPALAVLKSHAVGLARSGSDTAVPIDVPWLTVVAITVVVPVIAALLAGAFTRSRLPLQRRTA